MRIKNVSLPILITMWIVFGVTIGLSANETEMQDNIRNMFIYDECCSYIDDSQPNISLMLISFSAIESQIK
jgi:hypothetical protein